MEPIIRIDSDGLFKWDVITTYFDQDGVIQAKITAFDDGSQREDLYAGGVLDRVVTTDADIASGGANLYDWETITVYYATDGSKVADETIYDDGAMKVKLYEAGTLSQITETDPANARFYDTIETYYGPDGIILARETFYDDGRSTLLQYDNGVKAQETKSDVANVASWEQIETYFDILTGQKLFKTTRYDNGIERDEHYSNGALERVVQRDTSVDGATGQSDFAWDETTTIYDSAGNKVFFEQKYDNGLLRQTQFENGRALVKEQFDTLDSKSWDRISSFYDQQGEVFQTTTRYDNGIEARTLFEGGVRSSREENDWFNAANWRSKTTTYDAEGDVASTQVVLDNNDKRITVMSPDGTRDFMILVDGNNSDPWGVRVSDYDAFGANPVHTTYDSIMDVPMPYAGYLVTNDDEPTGPPPPDLG